MNLPKCREEESPKKVQMPGVKMYGGVYTPASHAFRAVSTLPATTHSIPRNTFCNKSSYFPNEKSSFGFSLVAETRTSLSRWGYRSSTSFGFTSVSPALMKRLALAQVIHFTSRLFFPLKCWKKRNYRCIRISYQPRRLFTTWRILDCMCYPPPSGGTSQIYSVAQTYFSEVPHLPCQSPLVL